MQNEVQTSIKIATEPKECANTQKKAKLKLELCVHLRISREKAVSMLGLLFSDDEPGSDDTDATSKTKYLD